MGCTTTGGGGAIGWTTTGGGAIGMTTTGGLAGGLTTTGGCFPPGGGNTTTVPGL